MELEEIRTAVDGYFSVHLDAGYWNNLDAQTRLSAVTMAISDICSVVQGLTLDRITPESPAINAIAEQAVYLVRNYETIAEGKVATSESAEGISTGYTLINSSFGISPRAEAFTNQLKRLFYAGTVRIARG